MNTAYINIWNLRVGAVAWDKRRHLQMGKGIALAFKKTFPANFKQYEQAVKNGDIAYFLQRLGEPLRLEFEKGFYGPYSHQLFQLLKY